MPSSSSQRPKRTSAPSPWARWANSEASRVLPMPGSPAMSTHDVVPAWSDRFHGVVSASSAPRDPGRGTHPPARRADGGSARRRRRSRAPTPISTVGTGSGSPLSSRSPMGVKVWPPRPRASASTTLVARICPPSAAAQSRAASITGVPKTSPSSTVTSPRPRPIRSARATCGSTKRWASMPCWMPTAAATARAAEPNVARNPSPMPLTTRPPCPSTISAIRASWARRTTSATSSPSRARSAVEPTTSVNRTVSVSRTPSEFPPSATSGILPGPTPTRERVLAR